MPATPFKEQLLATVRQTLRDHLERAEKAAQESCAAATDPDSQAENKYDTRSLEASYLARGQALQIEELAEAVRLLEAFQPGDFPPDAAIGLGALVELEEKGEWMTCLLVPAGGGLVLDFQGAEITLVTPKTRLFAQLEGRKVGQRVGESDRLILQVE
ncbi:MAG: transcription elongation factor [Verrucomicrobiota bacterium]